MSYIHTRWKGVSPELGDTAWDPRDTLDASVHTLLANNDVVDGNVNQLDKETNETHNEEPNSGGTSNLGEFLAVRLGATVNKTVRVLAKPNKGGDSFLCGLHDRLYTCNVLIH
eukprot:TRINITY_DN38521_c0_g1_i1.p1 TRINITY_DN38521_c0_g1~~TRINITY_DN38521_c0_g1_i1.p1  ORF type:complete len:113 (+),score=0.62 TRINITY_DN38521_c0_g1_i1:160-498(+)